MIELADERIMIEDEDSYLLYLDERLDHAQEAQSDDIHLSTYLRRSLVASTPDLDSLQQETEERYRQQQRLENEVKGKKRKEAGSARQKLIDEIYQSDDIVDDPTTVHGMMIDAGSTGSRMHVFAWDPRILSSPEEIQDAVSGNRLSVPHGSTRWTERLRPGLASLAHLPDDELVSGLVEYLSPLVEFAKAVLHTKQAQWGDFPIFLRATAGLRTLTPERRDRLMAAVRELFWHNQTFSPFQFAPEQASV